MTPLYLPTTDDRSAFAFCFLRRLLAFFPLSGLVPLPAAVAATIRRQVNRMTSRTVRQSGTRRTHAHSADRLVERGRVLRENTPPNDQTPCIESQLGQKKKSAPQRRLLRFVVECVITAAGSNGRCHLDDPYSAWLYGLVSVNAGSQRSLVRNLGELDTRQSECDGTLREDVG